MNKNWIHILLPLLIIYFLLLWSPSFASVWLSPVILIGAVSYLCYHLMNAKSHHHHEEEKHKNSTSTFLIILWGLLTLVAIIWAHFIYQANPIDITKSDILPLIKEVYYNRFIHGEFVYGNVQGYDYKDWTPNYLPLHWLPFVPAFYWGFDPRWISLGALLVVIGLYFLVVIKKKNSFPDKLINTLLPFIILFAIFYKQTLSVAHNVELLIAAFYMMLAMGIRNNNKLYTIIGFTTTILSRYMSLFFLPLNLYDSYRKKKQSAVFTYLIILLLIAILYIIPFYSVDPLIFIKGASAYDIAALGEWTGQSWQQPGDLPYQLFQGYGFASYFYRFCPGDLSLKITVLKYVLLSVMLLKIILSIALHKRLGKNPEFSIIILFLTITLFPCFALVPYNYLFWNLLFVSPVMLMNIRLFK